MSPDTVINEVLAEFGQFVGQREKVEELFWNAVWEVEASLKPPHTQKISDLSVTDAGTHGEIDMSTVADIYDILAVLNGSQKLARVSLHGIKEQPSWVPTASLWSYDPDAKKIIINKGSALLPSTLTVIYSARSGQVASAVELPWLADLYPRILFLLRLRLAELTGDTTKMQELLQHKDAVLLGRSR